MQKLASPTFSINWPEFAIQVPILKCTMDVLVWIFAAGNWFDLYPIVRQIPRQAPLVKSILGAIQKARTFNCFQAISLLEQTQTAK